MSADGPAPRGCSGKSFYTAHPRLALGCWPAATAVLFMLTLAPLRSTAAGDVAYHLIRKPGVCTLVNLHPDEQHRRLYSVNYQQAGLMPLCTPVMIQSVTTKHMTFEVIALKRIYEYIFHNSLQEPIDKHLDKFFGTTCDPERVEHLNPFDQDGVKQGRVRTGMTKEGVILAIGYPPEHATPGLQSNAWRYWKNRFGTMVIHFAGGKVVRVQD